MYYGQFVKKRTLNLEFLGNTLEVKMTVAEIFILVFIFNCKHLLADYFFQLPYMLRKFLPGWDFFIPLVTHAGVHAVFTYFIASLFLDVYLGIDTSVQAGNILFVLKTSLGLALFDFIAHFLMDRIKAGPKYLGRFKALSGDEYKEIVKSGVSPDGMKRLKSNTFFWWSLGLDSWFHHCTDLLIVYMMYRTVM